MRNYQASFGSLSRKLAHRQRFVCPSCAWAVLTVAADEAPPSRGRELRSRAGFRPRESAAAHEAGFAASSACNTLDLPAKDHNNTVLP
jgi:hypothetical protein